MLCARNTFINGEGGKLAKGLTLCRFPSNVKIPTTLGIFLALRNLSIHAVILRSLTGLLLKLGSFNTVWGLYDGFEDQFITLLAAIEAGHTHSSSSELSTTKKQARELKRLNWIVNEGVVGERSSLWKNKGWDKRGCSMKPKIIS